jgi:hypothetical protein
VLQCWDAERRLSRGLQSARGVQGKWLGASINGQTALCRDVLIDALSPLGSLGSGVAGGEGAIYLWAKLPEGVVLCQQHLLTFACMVACTVHDAGMHDDTFLEQWCEPAAAG